MICNFAPGRTMGQRISKKFQQNIEKTEKLKEFWKEFKEFC